MAKTKERFKVVINATTMYAYGYSYAQAYMFCMRRYKQTINSLIPQNS